MIITITENGADCIATVRDGDTKLSLWARHDHADWAYLGTLSGDGRSLITQIKSEDIGPLADQLEDLDDAFYAYADSLEVPS